MTGCNGRQAESMHAIPIGETQEVEQSYRHAESCTNSKLWEARQYKSMHTKRTQDSKEKENRTEVTGVF